MAELTKQELLLNDLSTIESKISILVHNNIDLQKRNSELENLLKVLKVENSDLVSKLEEVENKLKEVSVNTETNLFNTLNTKERENLKIRLQDLISKIDHHLSADRQA